jgi:hypothetical protein
MIEYYDSYSGFLSARTGLFDYYHSLANITDFLGVFAE